MSIKLFPKAALLSLLVAAASTPIGAAHAKNLKATPQNPPKPEVTGAIDPRGGGLAQVSSAVSHARAAAERFAEARAALEHGLLLRDAAPKSDIAAFRAGMKGLLEDLGAVEQMEQFASSAKDARLLANDWYQSGMKIIAPPAEGLTEMPLPMLVQSKADAVATALDWLVAEASASAESAPKVAAAAAAPAAPVQAAATPVQAAAPAPVSAPKSMSSMRVHQASRKVLLARAPTPMEQNEASFRFIRDGLPLLLPPVALFRR